MAHAAQRAMDRPPCDPQETGDQTGADPGLSGHGTDAPLQLRVLHEEHLRLQVELKQERAARQHWQQQFAALATRIRCAGPACMMPRSVMVAARAVHGGAASQTFAASMWGAASRLRLFRNLAAPLPQDRSPLAGAQRVGPPGARRQQRAVAPPTTPHSRMRKRPWTSGARAAQALPPAPTAAPAAAAPAPQQMRRPQHARKA